MSARAMKWKNRIYFHCPGCDGSHAVLIDDGTHGWKWNGDLNLPTFSPSVLVNASKFTEKGAADYKAWMVAGTPAREEPFESVPTVCHSYVRNGRIEFLNDCTHALAGKTVDLPEWDK
jgi:hypothetical protein